MTGNEAVKEIMKIVKKEYCSIRQELTRFKDESIGMEYNIYTDSKGWIHGKSWKDAIKQIKEKYKEKKIGN